MRNTLILVLLVTLGLTAPALADGRREEARNSSGHRQVERNQSGSGHHDRGERYEHFQNRMKHLRKDLRHERRENRRHERQFAYRDHYRRHPAPVVVVPRRLVRPEYFPSFIVQIPLYW